MKKKIIKNYYQILEFLHRIKTYFEKKYGYHSLERILKKNYKKGELFNFIQVGANDGVSFDFLYDFLVNRNSYGLVIEPIKSYFEQLKYNYKDFPNIQPLQLALHPTEKKISIYRVDDAQLHKYPEWVKGIASFDKQHLLKFNIAENNIITEIVDADNFNNIIEKEIPFNIQDIDYIQVDTEGFDYEVINMIDFGTVKPKIIKYESVNLSADKQVKLEKLFKTMGYYLFKEDSDTIAINRKEIKL